MATKKKPKATGENLFEIAGRLVDELSRFNDLREREFEMMKRQEQRASKRSGEMQAFLDKAFSFITNKIKRDEESSDAAHAEILKNFEGFGKPISSLRPKKSKPTRRKGGK